MNTSSTTASPLVKLAITAVEHAKAKLSRVANDPTVHKAVADLFTAIRTA
jgi:hypothetical protein